MKKSLSLIFGILLSSFVFGNNTAQAACDYDHGGVDWSVSDNDIEGWDMNPTVGTIEIAGTHCNIGNFVIPAGRTVYVKAYDGVSYGRVEIQAGQAEINGVLNANGRGYSGATIINPDTGIGNGPGGGKFDGSGPSWAASGAGYGGVGGKGAPSQNPPGGVSYSSLTVPDNMGSSGGSCVATDGAGGGLIKLNVSGTLTNNGAISTNGITGANSCAAGSSGGGIYISLWHFCRQWDNFCQWQ